MLHAALRCLFPKHWWAGLVIPSAYRAMLMAVMFGWHNTGRRYMVAMLVTQGFPGCSFLRIPAFLQVVASCAALINATAREIAEVPELYGGDHCWEPFDKV